MEIKLGQKVRCKITGIEGIATARCEYLYGCIHYGVTSVSTDGKYPDASYLDHQQLEIVDDGINTNSAESIHSKKGGPQINSPKR